ncbi:MAG: rRNA maturation RNase YbeY, partial [Pseudomonadota bacterium]|nr:rRNA maturation RNase YbeY [Pseudomonadota bacterium]
VAQQAQQQHKTLAAHWAHLIIHATLHLLGYVHDNEHAAQIMETIEINILKELGYSNPYELIEV